jgi:3-oxoadipate enol-lactonase
VKVEVEGGVLHVEVDGHEEAPALVLWNGAFCTTRMWDLVVPKLVGALRVVRFDVRGTGRSTPASHESLYDFHQYTIDVDVILDTLGIDRAHHWAMAWGSRAALAYASIRPERVDKLALYDASIGKADVEAQRDGHKEAVAKQTAAGIEPFQRPQGATLNEHPQEVPKALAAAARFDYEAAAARLTVKTLVATGDHDPNLGSSRELVELAPNAQLVMMKNVGHGSVLQRPDLTTVLFADFIKGKLD